jgi:Flavin containing amine oxidoreductase
VSPQVAVVGAGLSGLACALTLEEAGLEVIVVDRDSQVGGRVRSEIQDGYRFDVGFQVLLTGYPAARHWLDFEELDLRCFPAGALIHKAHQWHVYADPIRHPSYLWKTLNSPIGTLFDKLRLAWLRVRLWAGRVPTSEGESTQQLLTRWGFGQGMIDDFLRPFFGGIFLESELATSGQKFLQLFHYFSTSSAAVPAQGMGAIPRHLAGRLRQRPLLSTPVEALEGTTLVTPSGKLTADCLVLAGPEPGELWGGETTPFHSAHTYYFSCPDEKGLTPMLMLDADPGPINNIAPLSEVAPYAPSGRNLVAVSVLGQFCPPEQVRLSLARLLPFDWEFMRYYSIENALPQERRALKAPSQLSDRVFACGDHRLSGSIQGALQSGSLAAKEILQQAPWR